MPILRTLGFVVSALLMYLGIPLVTPCLPTQLTRARLGRTTRRVLLGDPGAGRSTFISYLAFT